MAGWQTPAYKGIEVPDAPTGEAGINLKNDLTTLADRAPNVATSDPGATDDTGDGYFTGSLWLNKTSRIMWVCVDATASAAVWRSLYRRDSKHIVFTAGDATSQHGLQMDVDGEPRGNNAVDLQSSRTANTQVASGNRSFIAGGQRNTASGLNAHAEGDTNTASGDDSHVEGQLTTASGTQSHAEGSSTTASGDSSHAEGYGSKASLRAQHAHAAGKFDLKGDAQTSQYVMRQSTTNFTATEMFIDGSSERLTIPSDTTWAFSILVVARRIDASNESAAYKFEGCIDNNGGTTALVGSVTSTVLAEDTAAWAVAVTASDANDALTITVTGVSYNTIHWVAFVRTVEVTGAEA